MAIDRPRAETNLANATAARMGRTGKRGPAV